MKQIRALLILAFIGFYLPLKAQEFKEIISKEVAVTPGAAMPTLTVNNVQGQVEVEGYAGNTIQIEVEKIITAPNQALLELGKKEINIKVLEKEERIYVYLNSPFTQFDEQTGKFTHGRFNGEMKFDFNFNSDSNKTNSAAAPDKKNEKPEEYDYRLHYKIKVPQKTNMDITSIANGNITVKNLQSENIKIEHLVGSINLLQVTGTTIARTTVGDITVTYLQNPTKPSRYTASQGNITVTFQKDLNAELVFTNWNGEIYSDFVSNELVKQELATKNQDKNKPAYLIKSKEVLSVGKNGPQFTFTNSGNIYIRKF